MLFQIICFYCIVNLILGANNKLMISIIFIYWVSQTVFFNFLGYSYTFLYGPIAVVFVQFTGDFGWGTIFEFWHHEFIIKFNTLSDKVYLGVNLVALIISVFLIIYHKTYFKYVIRNNHENSVDNKSEN
jgi:hypothetical protein